MILLFTGLLLALLVPAARLYLVPGVAVLAAGLAIWGLCAWRPPAARAWWTVTVGVGLLAIGYVISAVDAGRWPDLRREYPQPYDLIFVLGSAVVIVGAVLLLSRIHPSRDRGDLLDAVMVGVGFGSLIAQLMFGTQLAQGVPIGISPVTAVLFPLASVVLLAAVVRAVVEHVRQRSGKGQRRCRAAHGGVVEHAGKALLGPTGNQRHPAGCARLQAFRQHDAINLHFGVQRQLW